MKLKLINKGVVLLVLLIFANSSFAQSLNITGTVTDNEGIPLPGVNIKEKGAKSGTITSIDGKYKVKVDSKEAILVFSYIGFATIEQKVGSKTNLDVRLGTDNKLMNEVVVIGYGTVQRKEFTGSISSVKGEELSKVPVQDIATALTGRLAGVQVTTSEGAPGSSISIKVRGGGSITQSNEPLYVVDGVPQTDGLNFLDPTDIESIDVLKDAAATAIYGSRGANGVILVTTKQHKPGKTQVTYDTYFSAKTIANKLDVLTPYQYTVLQYERSLGDADKTAKFISNYGNFSELQTLYADRPGINWQDEVFGGTANGQYHKVGINGGNKDTRFNLFYSFNDDQGIMVTSGAKKNVAKLSLYHTANKKLKINGSVNYSDQKIFGIGTGDGNTYFNQLQNILTYRPTFGKSGSDQDLVDLDQDPILSDDSFNTLQNPLANAQSQQKDVFAKYLYLNGGAQYQFSKNISYKGIVSFRDANTNTSMFYDQRSVLARRNSGPFGSIIDNNKHSWNYSNTLSYSNTFNKIHKLDLLVGQEQNYTITKYNKLSVSGFPYETLGLSKISEAATFLAESNIEDEKIFSLFSRASYALNDKYLFSASIRADGSSKFGAGNKYGYFPAASAAWRIIEEDFMKNQNVVSDLKLRFSIGNSGNNRIANYSSLSLLNVGNYPLGDVNNVTVYSNTLPNPNLKWEQTLSQNLGLDVSFLNHKIQLTAEAYSNKTKDLLLNAEVPMASGYKNILINAGSTSNKGLEFTLNTTNINKINFKWNTNFNISFNKNKVLGLTSGSDFMYASSNFGVVTESDYIVRVGQSLGQIYGYQSDGLYQVADFNYDAGTKKYTLKPGIPYDTNNMPQPGFLKLVNQTSGDILLNADDRVVIGNAYPIHIGGLNNTFTYKDFDLSIFLNWSYGNDVYNANKLYSSQTRLDYRNALAFIGDRWLTVDANGDRLTDPLALTNLNAGKTVPAYNGSSTDVKLFDKMIEDGSFLRINNINFGYKLPQRVASKLKVGTVRVYVTAYNLGTITGYSGYDPEVSTRNSTGLTPGVDFGAYPRSRSFIAGLNLSF